MSAARWRRLGILKKARLGCVEQYSVYSRLNRETSPNLNFSSKLFERSFNTTFVRDDAKKARRDFREDALAERAADAKYLKAAEEKGFDPSRDSTEEDRQLDQRLDFQEDAAAERVVDKENLAAAEERGFNSDDYSQTRTDSKQTDSQDLDTKAESNTDDVSENSKSWEEKEVEQDRSTNPKRRDLGQYPASFVLPTTVPHIERLTKSEADHRQKILHLLRSMNLPPILHAFAYGSGVFSQTTMSRKQANGTPPMVDMVLSVSSPGHWHARNMLYNPSHYPWWIRLAPMWMLRKIQKMGAKVWYIPYVQVNEKIVKYGVVSIDDLCQDLLQWDTLYLSGRLQKPVATLFDSTDGRVAIAEQANLSSALRTSFLLLPEEFSEEQLYSRMASLSYLGDFRMRVPGGENQNKIRNIVESQRAWFRFMCADLITRFRFVTVESKSQDKWLNFKQNVSPTTRASIASNLPRTLRKRLIKHYLSTPTNNTFFSELAKMSTDEFERSVNTPQVLPGIQNLSETDIKVENLFCQDKEQQDHLHPPLITRFWLAVVQQDDFQQTLIRLIAETVEKPAQLQSLKGFITAGFTRSIQYVLSKISKYREGRKTK
ncbi:Mitochondrial translocator assembly and maintenance protein 41 [Malassezia yamatoensis]|uniref:Phosphatidate cytidylyltransferase, mitochondrial n=1 Tax=Malassezia yamatoensis TaxID=253288 RepID=A0AAJ5YS98_9BASI|nr:Mitochondrial translocator assembly and maintenance protein 41 [Malassezia yamatoensis]